jgi:uncharacterized membrane protein YbhN (UPF0104 family)
MSPGIGPTAAVSEPPASVGSVLPFWAATSLRRAVLAGAALTLSLATLGLLAWDAGWHRAVQRLSHGEWSLLVAVLAAHLLAYVGYTVGHHRLLNLGSERGVAWRQTTLILLVGFGAIPSAGGVRIDQVALRGLGRSPEEATISAIALASIEMALLTPVAWVCSLLLIGAPGVPGSESISWAIATPVLAVPAVLAAARGTHRALAPHADRHRPSWLEDTLAGFARALALVRHPKCGAIVLAGVAVYWAADILALWLSLRLCHVDLSVTRLILAYATGYLLTRRSLPLAGAGSTELLLSVALTWVGVPLAAAVPAVLVYRLTDLSLTLIPALRGAPRLMRITHPELFSAEGEV